MDRDTILARLRERIVAFAASHYSGEVAEDLAQDVLVVLQEKYARLTELSDLLPLSFRILRYKIQDARRKAVTRRDRDRVAPEDVPLAAPGDDPETEVVRKRMVERLIVCTEQLSDRCRRLLRLKLEGKSFPEIQRSMGAASINTIYTWDRRCRQRLLELMGGDWEQD